MITFTVTVQVAPAAIVPPLSCTPRLPAASAVPPELCKVAPVQVVVADSGLASVIAPGEVGNTSVNAVGESVMGKVALVLVSVMVKVLVSPTVMVAGLKALVISGMVYTFRSAVLLTGPAPRVWAVFTPLVVLGLAPPTLLVTVTVSVQLSAAGSVKPVKLKAVAPALKVLALAPTQVPPAGPALDRKSVV